LGEDLLKLVDDLIYNEIHDCDVAVEPRTELTLLLIDVEDGLDFLFPIISHALLVFQFAVGPRNARHADHCSPEVASRSNAIYLGLIVYVASKNIISASFLSDIGYDAYGPSYHKISVLKVGQIAYDPFCCFLFLESVPLVGVKKSVSIVEMKIFTQKSGDLPLGSERVVSYDHCLCVVLLLHWEWYLNLNFIFIFRKSQIS
jgi:hypothetical protein